MFPVDTHTHTVASTHAYSTIHDYIAQAKLKGIRLFATTDHGPETADSPHHWHFMNLRVLPRVVEGVGILRGIEANIRNVAGEIDCNDKMWAVLDLIQAGLHDPFFIPQDKDVQTQALINTIKSGKVQIITHPGNPKFPIHVDEVVQAAAEYRVALEVNNSSFVVSRQGSELTCPAIIDAAKRHGAYLVMGSDSHIAYSLGDFEHSLRLINAANFPHTRLLNTSPRKLLDFLEMHGKPAIPEFADF
ncbi:MAG: phosphatase [Plesiomonas sp.]